MPPLPPRLELLVDALEQVLHRSRVQVQDLRYRYRVSDLRLPTSGGGGGTLRRDVLIGALIGAVLLAALSAALILVPRGEETPIAAPAAAGPSKEAAACSAAPEAAAKSAAPDEPAEEIEGGPSTKAGKSAAADKDAAERPEPAAEPKDAAESTEPAAEPKDAAESTEPAGEPKDAAESTEEECAEEETGLAEAETVSLEEVEAKDVTVAGPECTASEQEIHTFVNGHTRFWRLDQRHLDEFAALLGKVTSTCPSDETTAFLKSTVDPYRAKRPEVPAAAGPHGTAHCHQLGTPGAVCHDHPHGNGHHKPGAYPS